MRNIEEQLNSLKQQVETESVAPQVSATKLEFVTPTEMVELPSRGIFYNEGHPLHKQTSVEIKQMTAKEEDILTNKSFIKKGIVIDRLIDSILIDKEIDVNTLLVGDKNAIMVAARINAYGPAYDVNVTCLECGNKNLLGIDLTQITVRDLDKIDVAVTQNEKLKHNRLEDGSLQITLPKSGWVATCRLLNGNDEKAVLNLLEAKKKRVGADSEITLSEQLYFIVQSINGVEDSETLKKAIGLMPAFDAKHLRTTYAKLIPNVAIEKKFTCSSCTGEQELEVPFTQEFFWPK